MPRQRNPLRETARVLWEDSGRSRLLKDIAAEIGVRENQLRKWKSEDKWETERSDSTCRSETERSDSKRAQPPKPKKRGGGKPGNRNAVGNKGGKGNPAPPGNKYALVTGEYESILFDSFTDAERTLAYSLPDSHQEKLVTEYRLTVVREYRIIRRIEAAQRSAERGMVPARVSVDSYSYGDEKGTRSRRSSTAHESLDDRMSRLEDSLTRVQEHIRKLAAQLHKFNYDEQRLAIERDKALLAPPKDLEERPEAGTGGLTIIYDYGGDEDG